MFGTVARIRVKPGMGDRLEEYMGKFEGRKVPGAVATYVYRMDNDPNELYMVAVFESRESYRANAESPEQDAEYRQLLELLVEEPEWHDGDIIHSEVYSETRPRGI